MFVFVNRYFARPEKQRAVLALRVEASALLAKLRLPAGSLIDNRQRVRHTFHDRPAIVWLAGYRTRELGRRAAGIASRNSDFLHIARRQWHNLIRLERECWRTTDTLVDFMSQISADAAPSVLCAHSVLIGRHVLFGPDHRPAALSSKH